MVSEAGIASGVRRIEAVVGPSAVAYLNTVDGVVRALAAQLKVKYEELPARVSGAFPATSSVVRASIEHGDWAISGPATSCPSAAVVQCASIRPGAWSCLLILFQVPLSAQSKAALHGVPVKSCFVPGRAVQYACLGAAAMAEEAQAAQKEAVLLFL